MARRRLLVIGVREASPLLAARWMLAGRLPHLRRVAERGVSGRLTAALPLETTAEDCHMLTGRGSVQHGGFATHWQRRPGGGYEIYTPALLRAPFFWELLAEQDRRAILLDVEVSDPRQQIKGCLLHFQSAGRASTPASVRADLAARFGAPSPPPLGRLSRQQFVPAVERQLEGQGDIATSLVMEHDWDFMLVDLLGLNIAQHYFWRDMESRDPDAPFRDVIERAFEAVDRQVGRLLDAAGPDATVFVVSACGAGPIRAAVQLNAWLRREGFQGKDRWRGVKRRAARAMFRAVPRRHLPGPVYRLFSRRVAGTSGPLRTRLLAPDFDWSRTRAFAMGEDSEIYIARQGRDPGGIVGPDAYEPLRAEIIQRLATLRDPIDGEKAVARVHRREDLFEGPTAELGPDLTIEWRDEAYSPPDVEQGEDVFVERLPLGMDWPVTGGHRREGLLMACGPGIRPGAMPKASIFDLFPTWLRLLGLPQPDGLDGHVLEEVLERAG